jgi:ubiquinone/menaquinone biosynthesis C-methylase UbiE
VSVDFSDPAFRRDYADRAADVSWRHAIAELIDPAGRTVVDLGCGGGIYTRAWHELGAAAVVGVDSSTPMLEVARESCRGLPGVTFRLAEAAATGLPTASADVVFARALIHHLADLGPLAREAARLLRPGGCVLLQDRSAQDSEQPGAPDHPRGWFFEVHPRLVDVENTRRHAAPSIVSALEAAGFDRITSHQLWEVRQRYSEREDYLNEVRHRTGRSILHELSDAELDHLVAELRRRLPEGPVTERDRWTLWNAQPQCQASRPNS